MKKPLLFTLLLASTVANAQMTDSNEPAIGETSSMFLCDSFAVNYDGVSGTGVTWDYSSLTGYAGEMRTVDVVDPATTPFASDFPSSTKAFQVENAMTTYFTSTASDRTSQGFQFNEATFGDVVATYTNDEQTLVTYPFAVGNSIQDTYDGNVDYTYNGFPVSETLVGDSYAWVDGEGTLLLPNGVSLTNVIRYKLIDTALTNIPILGAGELVRHQYEYYDYNDQNLPVFIHSTISIATQGGTPLATVSMVLSKYEAGYVGITPIEEVAFNVFPNPAANEITVNGEFSSEATGTIVDQSGRVLKTVALQNGQAIDIADLAEGVYMITIADKGLTSTKTIVKK